MKKIIFLFVLAITSGAVVKAETVETKEFDSANLTEVYIQNMSGNILINSTEAPKTTVSSIKKIFSDKCKMTLEKNNNKLIVKVAKSGFFSNAECAVDFEMSVPKSVSLEIISGSGDIKINGTQGEFTYKVGNSNIVANGEFSKINGKSGSGDLTVKGLSGGGELKTGSGSINLTFLSTKLQGELDIKTGSGDATLLFPKGAQIKTHFKAGSGQLTNELGDSANSEFKVSMKAGAGDLKIKSF